MRICFLIIFSACSAVSAEWEVAPGGTQNHHTQILTTAGSKTTFTWDDNIKTSDNILIGTSTIGTTMSARSYKIIEYSPECLTIDESVQDIIEDKNGKTTKDRPEHIKLLIPKSKDGLFYLVPAHGEFECNFSLEYDKDYKGLWRVELNKLPAK